MLCSQTAIPLTARPDTRNFLERPPLSWSSLWRTQMRILETASIPRTHTQDKSQIGRVKWNLSQQTMNVFLRSWLTKLYLLITASLLCISIAIFNPVAHLKGQTISSICQNVFKSPLFRRRSKMQSTAICGSSLKQLPACITKILRQDCGLIFSQTEDLTPILVWSWQCSVLG